MNILLATVLCLSVDNVQLDPITLTDPPIVSIDARGSTIRLSRWDAEAVASKLRERGFSVEQIAAAVRMLRLVARTEDMKCGTCITGGYDAKAKECVEGLRRSPCSKCRICADPLPEPIATLTAASPLLAMQDRR